MARRTDLLPEIESLCSEVDPAELATAVAGQAQCLAGLAMLLAFGGPSAAYAVGWSPAHALGWLPYANAETAAASRRALVQMFGLAA